MTERQLKRKLHGMIKKYYANATVTWRQASSVRPASPVITLGIKSISRHYQPVVEDVNAVPVDCYPSKTTVQIDLYTKGAPIIDDDNATSAMENTALDDLVSLVNYLNSRHISDWCMENDISIIADSPVLDTTQLIYDAAWDYRATTKIKVNFTQHVVGNAGIMFHNGVLYNENGTPQSTPPQEQLEPSTTGGGTPELANQSTDWIAKVEVEETEYAE